MKTETKEINNYQSEKFKNAEMRAIEKYLERYNDLIKDMSAGVGVCMLSKKMWRELIAKSNLKIVYEVNSPAGKLNIIKKIGILNKKYSEHNLMVLGKK